MDIARGRVVNEASKGIFSSSGLVKTLQLEIKSRHFLKVLQSVSYLKYKRIMQTSAMNLNLENFQESWAF